MQCTKTVKANGLDRFSI